GGGDGPRVADRGGYVQRSVHPGGRLQQGAGGDRARTAGRGSALPARPGVRGRAGATQERRGDPGHHRRAARLPGAVRRRRLGVGSAGADVSMATTTEAAQPVTVPAEPVARRRWYRRIPVDLRVAALYLLGGLWLTLHLWVDLNGRVLVSFPPDHYLFEFWLSHAARIFTHGENPFFTTQLNYPFGVNVMANTAMFGMTIPLVPVTLLFGPKASFAAMVMLA